MHIYHLRCEMLAKSSLQDTFAVFEDPYNLVEDHAAVARLRGHSDRPHRDEKRRRDRLPNSVAGSTDALEDDYSRIRAAFLLCGRSGERAVHALAAPAYFRACDQRYKGWRSCRIRLASGAFRGDCPRGNDTPTAARDLQLPAGEFAEAIGFRHDSDDGAAYWLIRAVSLQK